MDPCAQRFKPDLGLSNAPKSRPENMSKLENMYWLPAFDGYNSL